MFHGCELLKELNISNFVFNNSNNVAFMFSLCPEELKNKIKEQHKNIGEYAFLDNEVEEYDYNLCRYDSYDSAD